MNISSVGFNTASRNVFRPIKRAIPVVAAAMVAAGGLSACSKGDNCRTVITETYNDTVIDSNNDTIIRTVENTYVNENSNINYSNTNGHSFSVHMECD